MDNINILWEMDKVYFTNEKDLTAIEKENTITGDALLVGLPSNNAENILKKVKQIFSYKEEQIVCQNGDTATYYLSK